jgi:hypothetical protein
MGNEDIADCGGVPEWAISFESQKERERLKEILEIALYPRPMLDEQNMRGDASWIQLNKIPGSGPQVSGSRQKIMSLIRPV